MNHGLRSWAHKLANVRFSTRLVRFNWKLIANLTSFAFMIALLVAYLYSLSSRSPDYPARFASNRIAVLLQHVLVWTSEVEFIQLEVLAASYHDRQIMNLDPTPR